MTAHAIRNIKTAKILVEGEGFEPSKAEPSDLQSDPFDRSGTPPEHNKLPQLLLYTSSTIRLHRGCLTDALASNCRALDVRAAKPSSFHHRASVLSPRCPTVGFRLPDASIMLYNPHHSGFALTTPWCRHKELNPGPSHYK